MGDQHLYTAGLTRSFLTDLCFLCLGIWFHMFGRQPRKQTDVLMWKNPYSGSCMADCAIDMVVSELLIAT